MPDPISAMAGGTIVSGLMGASAARSAARTQAAAAREGIDAQKAMFERGLEEQKPFREAGIEANNMLMEQLRNFPQYQASRGLSPAELAAEQFNFQADPGYGFRLEEGLRALERSAAARGGLMGGATGKALQRYGQGLASQEYQNAFQRFQADRAARAGLGSMEYGQFAGERSARMLPLMQTAATGAGTSASIANQMANLGGAQASALGSMGAAQAAGSMGAANAFSNALGQGANLYNQYQQNQLLSDILAKRNMPAYDPDAMMYYASRMGQGPM